MNKALKNAQAVLGVDGNKTTSIYVGSDPDKAKDDYSAIAQKGESSKYSQIAWFGGGKLHRSCKLKKTSTKKKEEE